MLCMPQPQSVIEEVGAASRLAHDLLAQIAFSNCPGVAVLSQAFPGETQYMSLHPRKGARTDQSNGSTNVQFTEPVHFFIGVLIRL